MAKSVMNIYDKTSEMVAVQLTCEGKPKLKESLTPVLMHPIRYIDHVEWDDQTFHLWISGKYKWVKWVQTKDDEMVRDTEMRLPPSQVQNEIVVTMSIKQGSISS